MFAIITIPPDTQDVMAWCAETYPHMNELSNYISLETRGDFKTTIARTQAVVPAPEPTTNNYEDKFGDALVEIIVDYSGFLNFLTANQEEWVADQDE